MSGGNGTWITGAATTAAMLGMAALALAAPNPQTPKGHPIRNPQSAIPLLAAKCYSCHGGQAQLSGLRLDSRAALLKGGKRGPALVPGSPEKSLLLQAVHYDGPLKMPPAGKLNPAELAALAQWVKEGAYFSPESKVLGPESRSSRKGDSGPGTQDSGPLWALSPLRKSPVPAVKAKGWMKNPVDAFVLRELERRGMRPSPYADRRTLIRRASFDLTGLPPTPEEVEAFVNDRAPDAWAKVVDRLLASKHFGERMAQHWLDLARYADSDGYHDDTDRSMWAFRDYVIHAFNKNKPFDQFTVEQLAGDQLPDATFEQKVASAFNRCGPTTSEGGAIPEEVLARYAADRVSTTATVWMGFTMQCAECHDHKYDPLTAKDFYGLSAFFNQVPEEALYRGADAPPTLPTPTLEQTARLAEFDRQIAALEEEAKPRAGTADQKAEEARAAEAKKKLDAAKNARREVEKFTKLRIMQDVPERRPTFVLLRGDYRSKGEEVRPAVPAAFGSLPADAKPNRLTLARWIVTEGAPLTARVTVNRFWQMLWGAGLAATSEDFGVRGEHPTHPELLDYLAAEFVESGWDVKRVLKLIVTSAAYQQSSSSPRPDDAENRLLARGARFRLPAEFVRDNALAISGLLDRNRAVGGPSVKPYQPGDLWRELASGDQEAKSYVQDHGPDLYRRGIYTFWKRSVVYPSFTAFDAPKREVCSARRLRTNTPLQAFVTLNDTTYVEAARVFAQRILKEGGVAPEARLDFAYRVALARAPTPKERQVLLRLHAETLAQYRQDREGALKLVSAGESPRPADLDPAEHAAWACVCNAILNLDETITRE